MAERLSRDFVSPPEQPGEHVYEGIMFPGLIPASSLDGIKTWAVRPDDIFCVTYPKSGTHWILEIVSLIVNGGDASKIDRTHMGTGVEMSTNEMDPSSKLDIQRPSTPGYQAMESWQSPRVIATHLHSRVFPPDVWNKKAKVVYLARNPKDVICSTASFGLRLLPPELRDFNNLVKFMLLSDRVQFGGWFNHVLGWHKRTDDNILFLKYEDLQKNLLGEVKKIAAFIGHPLSDEVAEKVVLYASMDEMRKSYDKHEEEHPQGKMHTRAFGQLKFLNKGKVGNWKDKITGDLNKLFDEVYQEKIAGSGLDFEFEI